ncbi:MAG: hypothetical protein C4339_05130 [Nitrososphaerota archaeon]
MSAEPLRPWRANLYLPNYEGPCLTQVGRLILGCFGAQVSLPKGLTGLLRRLKREEKLLLVLADGLGYGALQALYGEGLQGLDRRPYIYRLSTTFPSTTASALVSLYTSVPPEEHGIAGYHMYMKEVGAVVNMVDYSPAVDHRRDVLMEAGYNPRQLVGQRTLFEALRELGVKPYALVRRSLKDSSLSLICYSGADVLTFVTLPEALAMAAQLLRQSEGPTFISLYWDGVDAVGHVHGPLSEPHAAEVRYLFRALHELVAGQGGGVLLTSDHGMVRVDAKDNVPLLQDSELMQLLLIPPTGEARAPILHARRGKEGELGRLLRRKYSEVAHVLASTEALRQGFFGLGRPRPGFEDRIGTYLLVTKGAKAFYFRYRGREQQPTLLGLHGGLSEQELLVPLLYYPSEKA